MDDACYVSFIVEAEGEVFSNLVETRRDEAGNLIVSPLAGSMIDRAQRHHGGEDRLLEQIKRAMGERDGIRPLSEATIEQREVIERKVHLAVNDIMGGRVVISVSHNDQPTHNPHYHIHRIRMWEAEEVATISQEEIEERNRTRTPYDGDRLVESG